MKLILLIIFILLSLHIQAQELLKFNVNSGSFDRFNCPISLTISKNEMDTAFKDLQLIEFKGESHTPLTSQYDQENNRMWFILDGLTPKNNIRKFAFVKKNTKNSSPQIEIQKNDGALQFTLNNKPILNYQYDIKMAPKGIDSKFQKSGFIHPLWSPDGEVLTRIQPPDHYHHYGIWGPWTKTHVDDREVDFWNLGKGQGTVLFKTFINETQGDVYSGFTALQEYIDFGATEGNNVAINEELEIKIWNLNSSEKSWMIDYTTTIKSPLESGILLDAYRYGGGIGFRATEKWHKDNTSVLTSENKDRLTADGTKAKWTIIEGETMNGRSSILFMGFPENRQFPEPMRVWPIGANGGRGDVFFEFCPIRHVEWKIEPDKKYQLKYRMLVFEGKISPKEAEIYWQGFANPPEILIEPK